MLSDFKWNIAVKRYILLPTFILAIVSLYAKEREEGEMLRIAKDKLQTCYSMPTDKLDKLMDMDMLSVYGSEEGGYVVVNKSTLSSPCIGYSSQRFNPGSLPDGLQWWLSQADLNLCARERSASAPNLSGDPVAPFISTKWAQESPFNSLCPKPGGSWGSSMTGCVATAMAQAMKYFNYPVKADGKGAYSIDNGASFKEMDVKTVYKWEKMREKYGFGASPEECEAVAELMRDCGYVSKMIYTSNGSGANLYDAAHGLSTTMGYDSLALRVRARTYYNDKEWFEMVNKELRECRPIIYSAVDPEKMGHSFVFDGLDANGFVHVNWGWSGDANGYFDLSVVKGLNPSYPNPYGGIMSYCFTNEQVMIIGMRPDKVPSEGAEYESFFVSEKPGLLFEEDTLVISELPVFNMSHLDFRGILGLVVEGEDGHAVVLPFFYSSWEDGAAIPYLGGVMYPEEYYASGTLFDSDRTTPRPDGKYLLYFISWAEQEMKTGITPRNIHFPVENANGGITVPVIWEANIADGHWVQSSLREYSGSSQIDMVRNEEESVEQTLFYGLDGLRIPEESIGNLMKGKPVIVRDGIRTKKVIP